MNEAQFYKTRFNFQRQDIQANIYVYSLGKELKIRNRILDYNYIKYMQRLEIMQL